MTKLWGGRFEGSTDAEVEAFTSSLSVDVRLAAADISASIAHARMLGQTGILPPLDSQRLVQALQGLQDKLAHAKLKLDPQAEDIHSEIERWLGETLGPLSGKLHTARSRNDQVATATRLFLRGESDALDQEIARLQQWLVGSAETHLETLLPGTTHLQHAQPVSLAHHLLAYFWMLQRDRERLRDGRRRLNSLPLGAAALAGTSFPIDRAQVAQELGFESIAENSLDAVSDRDFVVEFLSSATLIMVHLSRLAEELILWSTPEFGFIELSDAVTTGSSILPQKKNPDVLELIRGRVGRASGALVGAITMLKGLPLSYHRDLQEDKVHLFQGLDTARSAVRLMQVALQGVRFETRRMSDAVRGDFSNATDLADYLARKGLPFREAHEVVGRIVRACLEKGQALETMALDDLRTLCPLIDADVSPLLKHEAVLRARTSRGGTGPDAVREQLKKAQEHL